jgi:molybdate transport system ATP-binding protein
MTHGLDANFEKAFPGGPVIRLRDFTSRMESGITVLFGASGSGKTTVLRCIAGLEKPGHGYVRFGGEIWSDAASGTFLPARRRRVGLVPQNYALFPHLTVAGNVAYGLSRLPPWDRHQRVAETLDWLGLDGLEKRLPRELSGGQQQRVALARALAPRPQLLLLDEPLSALDLPTRLRLRGELRGWLQAAQVPAILVTHDRQEAATLGDDIIVMHEGRTIQIGAVQEVFSKPVSADVADILAVETILPGEIVETREGIATVQVYGVPLQALCGDLPPDAREVFVCIRAEDVSLSSPDGHPASPRNRLLSVVTGCSREGPLVRVELDCGFPLSALLTPQGSEALGLAVGSRTSASIKAPKIHLIPR